MRVHCMLQGGSFDGVMFSMFASKKAKDEIRIATMDAGLGATGNSVPVEVYALIEVTDAEIPHHLHAAYRWAGGRQSSIALVDQVLFKE